MNTAALQELRQAVQETRDDLFDYDHLPLPSSHGDGSVCGCALHVAGMIGHISQRDRDRIDGVLRAACREYDISHWDASYLFNNERDAGPSKGARGKAEFFRRMDHVIAGRAKTLNEARLGKVITNFVYPPIPPREFDWCAYRDGTEEGGRYGYGATEAEAIAALLMLEDE